MDRKLPPRGLKPVRASDALAQSYRRRLSPIIRDIAKDIQQDAVSLYRRWREGRGGSSSIVSEMTAAFASLRGRWERTTEKQGRVLASAFVEQVDGQVNLTFRRMINSIGVKEQDLPERPVRLQAEQYDIAQSAAIAENVGLITSIPAEYLKNVEFDVLQALQGGWPLDELSASLQEQYGITQSRADLIATDQCRKVTGKLNQQRMLSVGFKEADWWHSAGSRYPRKSHIAANGRRFKIEEGCFIDHEHILPGQKIRCNCFMTPVIPGR